jgi:hypothetical protein
MTHPGEGTLQALLDGELDWHERAELERHLAECERCQQELAELHTVAGELDAALRLLDEPARVDQARWRFERRVHGAGRGFAGATLRRTAILILGSAAVLSATVPGSPVREWLAASWDRVSGAEQPAEPEPSPVVVAVERAATPAPAGVSIRPLEGPTRVTLTAPDSGVRVRVTLHDGERLGVWASGEAARARFRTAPDRIEVERPGPGELRIEVPRAIAGFTLEVDGRPYLLKNGEQLRFPGPAADTVGPEILFEVQP